MNKEKKEENKEEKIVIDATHAILGRMASYVSKQALRGKHIVIVNCSKAIIVGDKDLILKDYQKARRRGGSALKGPNKSKLPYKIVKRTVRGMLPYKKERGRKALGNVVCFNDLPKEYENSHKIKAGRQITTRVITLEELSELM